MRSRPRIFIATVILSLGFFLFADVEPAAACSTVNPTAVVSGYGATTIYHGDQITFSGVNSYDNDEGGYQVLYYWWYVDGSYVRYGSSYTRTFNLPVGVNEKTYAVKLKVKDDDGQYGYKTVYITVKRPAHFFFYVKDHLGSTRAVVNEYGEVVEANDYYPFGLKSRGDVTGAEKAKESFTGKEYDEPSNIYYFGARFYDPASARWLSVDPLSEKYPSLSPFNYVANDPVNLFDPDGRAIKRGNRYIGGNEAKKVTQSVMTKASRGESASIDYVGEANNWEDFKNFLKGGGSNSNSSFNEKIVTFGDQISYQTILGDQTDPEFHVNTDFSGKHTELNDSNYLGSTKGGEEVVSVTFTTSVTKDGGTQDVIVFTNTLTKINEMLKSSGKKVSIKKTQKTATNNKTGEKRTYFEKNAYIEDIE